MPGPAPAPAPVTPVPARAPDCQCQYCEAELVRHAGLLGWRRQDAVELVDYLCRVAHRQEIHFLWRPALTDPNDEFVLELAVAAGCDALVTHNVRDFGGASRFAPRVLTPFEFSKVLEEQS